MWGGLSCRHSRRKSPCKGPEAAVSLASLRKRSRLVCWGGLMREQRGNENWGLSCCSHSCSQLGYETQALCQSSSFHQCPFPLQALGFCALWNYPPTLYFLDGKILKCSSSHVLVSLFYKRHLWSSATLNSLHEKEVLKENFESRSVYCLSNLSVSYYSQKDHTQVGKDTWIKITVNKRNLKPTVLRGQRSSQLSLEMEAKQGWIP